jgi:hypothetical protein
MHLEEPVAGDLLALEYALFPIRLIGGRLTIQSFCPSRRMIKLGGF